ncbi:hypothetical protein HMPREF1531_00879 [Propionibacterium sp. oral taxon 192 str. F0372]|nr:hypothetical protein HMPREF1531_00879 [Propionibacterium sp. oral taxon 192 str. F0372]
MVCFRHAVSRAHDADRPRERFTGTFTTPAFAGEPDSCGRLIAVGLV